MHRSVWPKFITLGFPVAISRPSLLPLTNPEKTTFLIIFTINLAETATCIFLTTN